MHFTVDIDPSTTAAQGSETFVLTRDGHRRTMRIHDYDDVYAVPGLYEHVVQERLQCTSPQTLASALASAAAGAGVALADVRCLDVGAGNGVSGEALRDAGLSPVVGLDVSTGAAHAVARDRPGLYETFVTGGLNDIDASQLVGEYRLNALVGAGALTGGHIEPATLATTWASFAPGDWLAFTCPEQHGDDARADFGDTVRFEHDERFRHRLLTDGTPVYYRVLVGRHS